MSAAEYELLVGWDDIITASQPQQQHEHHVCEHELELTSRHHQHQQYQCLDEQHEEQRQPSQPATSSTLRRASQHKHASSGANAHCNDDAERALYTTDAPLESILIADSATSAFHASTLQHLPLPSDLAPYSAATVEATSAATRPRGVFAAGPRFPATAASPVLVAYATLTDLVLRRVFGSIATGPLLHPAPLVGGAPATTWEAPGMQYLRRHTVAEVFHSAAADALSALAASQSQSQSHGPGALAMPIQLDGHGPAGPRKGHAVNAAVNAATMPVKPTSASPLLRSGGVLVNSDEEEEEGDNPLSNNINSTSNGRGRSDKNEKSKLDVDEVNLSRETNTNANPLADDAASVISDTATTSAIIVATDNANAHATTNKHWHLRSITDGNPHLDLPLPPNSTLSNNPSNAKPHTTTKASAILPLSLSSSASSSPSPSVVKPAPKAPAASVLAPSAARSSGAALSSWAHANCANRPYFTSRLRHPDTALLPFLGKDVEIQVAAAAANEAGALPRQYPPGGKRFVPHFSTPVPLPAGVLPALAPNPSDEDDYDPGSTYITPSMTEYHYALAVFETTVHTPAFLALSRVVLRECFLRSPLLQCDEFALFQALVRWGRVRLRANGLDDQDPRLVRLELWDLLPLIRFQVFSTAELNAVTVPRLPDSVTHSHDSNGRVNPVNSANHSPSHSHQADQSIPIHASATFNKNENNNNNIGTTATTAQYGVAAALQPVDTALFHFSTLFTAEERLALLELKTLHRADLSAHPVWAGRASRATARSLESMGE